MKLVNQNMLLSSFNIYFSFPCHMKQSCEQNKTLLLNLNYLIPRDLWDIIKQTNICTIGVLEEERKEQRD